MPNEKQEPIDWIGALIGAARLLVAFIIFATCFAMFAALAL